MSKKNTGKAPSIQLYYKDLVADMRGHGPVIFGAWMQILCQIWHEKTNGKITKTLNQLALIIQTSEAETQKIIDYISSENIADVTQCNGNITIINRRHRRECKLREQNRLRQLKYRESNGTYGSNADVTNKLHHPSSSSSSSSSLKNNNKKETFDKPKNGIVKIEFNFETRKFTEITEQDITSWQEAFPAVDIMGEIRKAREWLLANPKKRKKNYRRFLTSWFSRTQEKGGSRGHQNNHDPPSVNSDVAARKEIEETRKLIESAKKYKNA